MVAWSLGDVVATYHGGVELKALGCENLEALQAGLANLERHVRNVREVYGLPCVVSVNHFSQDTAAEHALIEARMGALGVPVVIARHWAEGGKGAEDLAHAVVRLAESGAPSVKYVYEDSAPLWEKVKAVATRVYGAADISADAKVRGQIQRLQDEGYGAYPVCIAKTQYSFSTDASARGAPSGHVVNIREVRLAAGAEFIVGVCGDIMTMPGLPKVPAASRIDLDADGRVVGLF
ncbi:MAG: formate--tetrahydrofolate ligase, partial [Betaproteobacteria bacterium]